MKVWIDLECTKELCNKCEFNFYMDSDIGPYRFCEMWGEKLDFDEPKRLGICKEHNLSLYNSKVLSYINQLNLKVRASKQLGEGEV